MLATCLATVAIAAAPAVAYPLGPGYWLTSAAGGVSRFGEAQYFGHAPRRLPANIVGAAAVPFLEGYWMVTSKGNVYRFGSASFHGSLAGRQLSSPIVGIVPTSTSLGYWLPAANGTVYNFGDAPSFRPRHPVSGRVVGMARTPDSHGYWLVTSAGHIYRFGNAGWYGSLAGRRLAKPIVGIVSTIDGRGYWLVDADGTVYHFGDAPSFGSKSHPAAPVTGMSMTPSGRGYWLTTSKGDVYAFGDAHNYGSIRGRVPSPIVAITTRPPLAVKVDAYVGSSSESSNWVHTNLGWRLELAKTASGGVPAGARVLGVEGIEVSQLKTLGFTYESGACDNEEPYFLLYVRTKTGAENERSYSCGAGGSGSVKRFNPMAGATGAPPLAGTDVVESLDIVEPVKGTETSLDQILVAGITVNDYRTYTADHTIIG